MTTLLALLGCNSGTLELHQGVAASYTTRCSSRMTVKEDVYTVDCAPPLCHADFEEVAMSHVVVAIDPGEKLVGYAERTCLQTLQALQETEPGVLEPEAEAEE